MEFDYHSADGIAWVDISGGKDLVAYFGHDPIFHDGEIVGLVLNRRAESSISIHIWGMGDLAATRHAVVTLVFTDVADLELECFSHQNVINGLIVRRAPERGARRPYYGREPQTEDIEIELRPCFGLCGFIRAASVTVSFEPGRPKDAY